MRDYFCMKVGIIGNGNHSKRIQEILLRKKILFTIYKPNNKKYYDKIELDELKKHLDPYDIALQTATCIKDSALFIIPDYDFSIIAYDIKKQSITKRFSGLSEKLKRIDIHPNGYFLAIRCREII